MGLDAPVSNLQDVDLRLLPVFTSVVRNGGFTATQDNVKMKRLVSANADFVLSLDVDGLDPSLVPGVILPALGGSGYQQMLDIIQGVCAKTNLVDAIFVEYMPEQDPTGSGAKAISRLAENIIASAFPVTE